MAKKRTGNGRNGRTAPPEAVRVLSTVSGPSLGEASVAGRKSRASAQRAASGAPTDEAGRLAVKVATAEQMAASIPHNPLKAREYGDAARAPQAGEPVAPADPIAGASTVTEDATSAKLGDGPPAPGENRNGGALDVRRADSAGRMLTTNQGVPLSQNQDSLKGGLRGPSLLEDFILREKLTHFDHERIPERVVHARGSGAHGYFECTAPLTEYTRAALFAEAGKRTPVFARFSTVIGERGSTDTARDVRGFAVKFYTDEGNFDLVGNNMPVFFIQDAMKFPDLIHAAKPEPHFAMPQAATAHDTFWDFISLMPESTHMMMWAMSDRAIPRSYRMMQGFGVHTFRLVNAAGASTFCKFHWTPKLGTHSLVWDEAVKISGADPDFHRRDLWEAIEAGVFPEFELAVQLFTEEQAERWSFDVLDATKLVPEELVPLTPVGTLVLDRNPDNFFAETEQVAFCTAHVVPGIDFTNDPLMQGRIHSYVDTQLLRLGGANFHEIPINAPVVQIHNNQRDGFHRQTVNRGRVAYEPNSLAGGCPFQAGALGFVSMPERVEGDKVRGRPERFAEHYAQATLFWRSQTAVERAHIVKAFRFELARVQSTAVRTRMVANLRNVDETLAAAVAAGLGIDLPDATPMVIPPPAEAEVAESPALSLMARPGDGSIATRRIAILVADGIDGEVATAVHAALAARGAVPRFVGPRLGTVAAANGEAILVDVPIDAMPSVLWDAVAIPGGDEAVRALAGDGYAVEFVKDQYRHAKPILSLDGSDLLLAAAAVPMDGPPDPGLIQLGAGGPSAAIEQFVAALGQHRHFARETDPPRV